MAVYQESLRKSMLKRLREDVYMSIYNQPRKKTLPPINKSPRKSKKVFNLIPNLIVPENQEEENFNTDNDYNLSMLRTLSMSSASSSASNVTQLKNLDRLEFQRSNLSRHISVDSSNHSTLNHSLSLSKRQLNRRKKQQMLGAKFRRLSHFLVVLFSVWKQHRERVKKFMENNVDMVDVESKKDLLFDVTAFKIDSQLRVSNATRRILAKDPSSRTKDELHYLLVALRNYEAISEYPVRIQKMMAARAWYERYDSKRVIIRQGHVAKCYYFILSGSVVVTKMENETGHSNTVCFINRGDCFGDIGIANQERRLATVISKESIELLVFDDEDFVEIFMSGGLKNTDDPFFSSVDCLNGWPVHLLAENKHNAMLSYFKRKTVLIHDSKISDWICIVKSGSCTVLKKLNPVTTVFRSKIQAKPSIGDSRSVLSQHKLLINQGFKRHEDYLERTISLKNRIRSLRDLDIPWLKAMVIREQSAKAVISRDGNAFPTQGPFLSQTGQRKEANMLEIFNESASPEGSKKTLIDSLNSQYMNSQNNDDKDRATVFVRVQVLTKGNVFGLADLIHGEQTSLTLVSNGTECILINKRFYMENLNQALWRRLRRELCPYPTDNELLEAFYSYMKWRKNKKKEFQRTLQFIKR
ncbi:DgyrCDS4170 [Dimorphilus gyrociliatus]|uniref:DgyrCDS4170 n=1 Tax=Dimorphilus gyrociliatus TaxID=2664684 RepID=A0A7I8VHL7_9ANNE|nr:DgyrCDS4170 [Dimorphilus gyrociliatus]